MTLNSIWLSGSAPSRLIQRSSTMPGSSNTSLRGSISDPRAWPQLWDSYVQTQILSLAWLFGKLNADPDAANDLHCESLFFWVTDQKVKAFIPPRGRGTVTYLVQERTQQPHFADATSVSLPKALPSYLGSVWHVFEENIGPDFRLFSIFL